jgi:plasmid maintenance system antidote protein VapI
MKNLTTKQQRYIEGYAAALQDILRRLTGDNCCNKHYDPMTCESTVMHSYAFNMKDGGRHHDVKDYKDLDEIKKILLDEVVQDINPEEQPGSKTDATPGAVLLAIMQDRNWCNQHVATFLNVQEQWLEEFLTGQHPVTDDTAERLEILASFIKKHQWLELNKNVAETISN